MRFNRHLLSLVILICCVVFSTAHLAIGQTETATISGLIVDSSGAIVRGAPVELHSTQQGTSTTAVTNDAGIYLFASVQPGQYSVTVRKQGFKQVDLVGIVANVQDHIEQNFKLEIGSVSESVTVTADSNNINTTDGSVSTVVDSKMVENMPLNGRSLQDLILLTPGIVTQTPQLSQAGNSFGVGQTGEFSVNGQRTESNNFTVDGVSANVGASTGNNMISGAGISGSVASATALGTTQALVSVDDLQEFRIQSSTYSAEYGRNPGGQFAFETKSGTNQGHGTAYDYLRNGFADAEDWFNDYFGLPEPAIRQNDFGGTFGGPVEVPGLYNGKDKTFFFVSYEGLRLTAPQAATPSFVPDLCMRGTGNCPISGPGAGRAPAASALLPVVNSFPLPSPTGLEDAANGLGQFIGSWSNPGSLDSTSIRFDHVVNDKLKPFFRFSDTISNSATRGGLVVPPSLNTVSAYTLRTYTAGISSIFSVHLTNEFRLNYSSNGTTNTSVIDAFGGGSAVNLVQLSGLSPGAAVVVNLLYGGYQVPASQSQASGAQSQWNLVDAVNLSLGRHQFKFGIDYRRLAPFAIQPSPEVAYYYFSEPNVETNSAFLLGQAFASAYPLYVNFSAFANDEWKVSRRLNVSLGLRWDVNPAPSVTRGLYPYTIQGTNFNTATLAPQGTPLWQTTWFNLAPRLGAAYVFHSTPGWEAVVRGGVGVFFDTGQQLGSQGFNGPGFNTSVYNPTYSFPCSPAPCSVAALIPPIVNPPQAPYNSFPHAFDSHLQLPYTLQWNFSIEQALGKSQAMTVSYVGSRAARLLQLNLFSPASNPNFPLIFYTQNGLTADYNSLQGQVQRRLNKGLTALASYTWSHCIDYGSENYNLAYQRGNCDFDVRQSLSTAFSYDVPNMDRNRLLRAVLNQWGLDDRFTARSSFPVTLNGNEIPDEAGQYSFAGLDFVPGQPVYIYGSNCATLLQGLGDLQAGHECPGDRAINPNAFTQANSGLGDAPRNFARGFGDWQMDTAIRRAFPIHESLKLQFRAEAFNVFNHPNFGSVNSNFGQPTFGQTTATLAQSLGVLSPLYQQGGPRSLQFALKLVF